MRPGLLAMAILLGATTPYAPAAELKGPTVKPQRGARLVPKSARHSQYINHRSPGGRQRKRRKAARRK